MSRTGKHGPSHFPDVVIDTDKGDIVFVGTLMHIVNKNCVVKETKLVRLVDELALWEHCGGSLEVK